MSKQDREASNHRMDALAAAIRTAMEQAAISGLCREGQLEMAAQAVRQLAPDLTDAELHALLEAETGA